MKSVKVLLMLLIAFLLVPEMGFANSVKKQTIVPKAVTKIVPKDVTKVAPKDVIKVIIDNLQYNFDSPPVMQDGRVLVPFRGIFEALGVTVHWDSSAKLITTDATDSAIKLSIVVGEKFVKRNDTEVELDVPSVVIKGRVFVPVRFAIENSGANVTWDGKSRTVVIERHTSNTQCYLKEDGTYVNARSQDVNTDRVLLQPNETRPRSEPLYTTANAPGNYTAEAVSNDSTLIQTLNYMDGSTYTGTLKNGLREGKGKFVTSDFSYEGDWSNDLMNGQGKQSFVDSATYEGTFVNDQWVGQGVYIGHAGERQWTMKGEWKDGELIKSE